MELREKILPLIGISVWIGLLVLPFVGFRQAALIAAAIAVVAANLIARRGLAGAEVAWPGSTFSGGRLPQGRTAKITVHQITTKTMMPV